MSESSALTVLLCGVGGQGTILAADVLARVALYSGYEVKISEIHGMSQRGGAVSTVVRFGAEGVHSMMTDKGCADFVMSFETTEALRNIAFLKDGGYLLVADERIKPLPVLIGSASMPQNADERLLSLGAHIIPAHKIALEASSPKSVNIVLLGALATQLPFEIAAWEQVIASRVPQKTISGNLQAFKAGFEFAGGVYN